MKEFLLRTVKQVWKHIFIFFGGFALATYLIVVEENTIDVALLGTTLSVCIFIPFLFSFFVFDRLEEPWQVVLLTYGTTLTYGMLAAVMLFLGKGSGLLQWFFFFLAYGMCLAVWASSHQSRSARRAAVAVSAWPPALSQMYEVIDLDRQHAAANKLVELLGSFAYHKVVREWDFFRSALLRVAQQKEYLIDGKVDEAYSAALSALADKALTEVQDWPNRVLRPSSEGRSDDTPLTRLTKML